jgi:hypothetical protein
VNGKQKWRTLNTSRCSVAKLRLSDFEEEVRAQGMNERRQTRTAESDAVQVEHFIGIFKTIRHLRRGRANSEHWPDNKG